MPKVKRYCENVKVLEIERTANLLREEVIKMLLVAKSGHPAGSLGTAEIFAALYFHILGEEDKFILSNGHVCPIWYAALAQKGFFPKSELNTYAKIGSRLQAHPHRNSVPGVNNNSGPLGQGLSLAIGQAIAAKMDAKSHRIYCMTSDGELNEGQVWEAAMLAPKQKLINLTWIIDRNNIQIGGMTEDILPLEPLRAKLESFNWYVIEIDGHNVEEIINACDMAKAVTQRPTVIVAHTIPGKSVEFMQYKFDWHGKAPDKNEAAVALKQLRSLEGRIESE